MSGCYIIELTLTIENWYKHPTLFYLLGLDKNLVKPLHGAFDILCNR